MIAIRITPLVTTLALLGGCEGSLLRQATAPDTVILRLDASYDSHAAAQAIAPGQTTIVGSAFLRQSGGGIVTCAGREVRLIPATIYARARMLALYGTAESGVNRSRARPIFVPDPPDYLTHTRATKCDAQGNFEFDRVRPGDYFVATHVAWQIGYSVEGGGIMLLVQIAADDQRKKVVLSQ